MIETIIKKYEDLKLGYKEFKLDHLLDKIEKKDSVVWENIRNLESYSDVDTALKATSMINYLFSHKSENIKDYAKILKKISRHYNSEIISELTDFIWENYSNEHTANLAKNIKDVTEEIGIRAGIKTKEFFDSFKGDKLLLMGETIVQSTNYYDEKMTFDIIDLFCSHYDQPNILYFIRNFSIIKNKKKSTKHAKTLVEMSKYIDNKEFEILARIVPLCNEEALDRIQPIIDKYPDFYATIFDGFFGGKEIKEGYFDELLSERAYDKLKNSSNINKALMSIRYSLLIPIEDSEVSKNCNYSDFELIGKTNNFVQEVHKNRSQHYKTDIRNNFYKQLNRAINQGQSLHSKINNLREYCTEVRNKIEENAGDLMVVHND